MYSIGALRIGSLACLALLVQPEFVLTHSAQSIRQVASLQTARAAHTATTLQSGLVLVVGGMSDGGGGMASVELFDPARNTVQQLDPLADRRASHTATLLGNGRVLITGGYNGEYLASVEAFDPSAKRFRSAGSLLEPRSGHTATLLPDGRVLLVGGVGRGWTFLRSAEVYDPETGRSEMVGSMRMSRESHTATLLADGRVLVVGGHSGRRQNMEVYATAELFNPQTRRFESAGRLTIPRHKHDAVRLADGRVLIIGGADHTDRVHYATTEIYRAPDHSFRPGPAMTYARYKIAGTSILLSTGEVLVTSGAQVAELLNVQTWRFAEVPGSYPAAYRFAATALLRDGDVLLQAVTLMGTRTRLAYGGSANREYHRVMLTGG
ncbi:MAG: kelch repeat-containing protein [Gemmatimonadota bacterium]